MVLHNRLFNKWIGLDMPESVADIAAETRRKNFLANWPKARARFRGSDAQLARAAGVSDAMVSRLRKQGTTIDKGGAVSRLAAACGVEAASLWEKELRLASPATSDDPSTPNIDEPLRARAHQMLDDALDNLDHFAILKVLEGLQQAGRSSS